MTEPSFKARMAEYGLAFPESEIAAFESFVKDLERAAQFVRDIDRSYLEEPSTVFSPAPTP